MFGTPDATDGDPAASAATEPWDIDFCGVCGRPVPSGFTVCFECDTILHSGEWIEPNEGWSVE